MVKYFSYALIAGQSLDYKDNKLLVGSFELTKQLKIFNVYSDKEN